MAENSTLTSLVYVSEARRPMDSDELTRLLGHIAPRNRLLGITGMLLYKDGCFIQALEGPDLAVQGTLARIRQDRRHQGVVVLQEGPVFERQFPRWSMGFQDLNEQAIDFAPTGTAASYTDFLQSPQGTEEWSAGDGHARLLMRAFRNVTAGFALPQSRGR